MSLRARILLAVLVVAAVALVMGGLVARQAVRSEIVTVTDIEIDDNDVAEVDLFRSDTGSWDGVDLLLEDFDSVYGLRFILTDVDEQVLYDTRAADDLPPLDLLPAYQFSHGPAGERQQTLLFTVDIMGSGGSDDALRSIDRRFLLAGLASLVVAGLMGLWLANLVTRPVRGLTQSIAAIRGGAPSPAPEDGPGELGTLGKSFNEMAQELERSESNRQAMVADAAHELRTPLANLKGHLEGISDGVIEPDEATIGGLVGDVDRLGLLVDDLQSLAMAEADSLPLTLSPADPAAILGRVAATHSARASANGIAISVQAPADLPRVAVDELRIDQVMGNLVANATRYGDQIQLVAAVEGPNVNLSVTDNGPGIPADQLEKVFDRFYRTDPSRDRATGQGGLGLSIVKQFVRLHGGTVTAESVEGAGSTFTVSLPALVA